MRPSTIRLFSNGHLVIITIPVAEGVCLLSAAQSFSAQSFSALTLLVGWQEGHPACKNLSGGVLAWLSVWSQVQT